MSAQNGGPAFPCEYVEHERGAVGNQIPIMGNAEGISVRDYFAAKADMGPYNPRQALESKLDRQATMGELAEYIAKIRHLEADAMLAERAK